jgi:hypothetical protein
MCISNFKNIFPEVIPSDPHDKGEGKGKEEKEGRGGEESEEWDGVNPRKQILATALIWTPKSQRGQHQLQTTLYSCRIFGQSES